MNNKKELWQNLIKADSEGAVLEALKSLGFGAWCTELGWNSKQLIGGLFSGPKNPSMLARSGNWKIYTNQVISGDSENLKQWRQALHQSHKALIEGSQLSFEGFEQGIQIQLDSSFNEPLLKLELILRAKFSKNNGKDFIKINNSVSVDISEKHIAAGGVGELKDLVFFNESVASGFSLSKKTIGYKVDQSINSWLSYTNGFSQIEQAESLMRVAKEKGLLADVKLAVPCDPMVKKLSTHQSPEFIKKHLDRVCVDNKTNVIPTTCNLDFLTILINDKLSEKQKVNALKKVVKKSYDVGDVYAVVSPAKGSSALIQQYLKDPMRAKERLKKGDCQLLSAHKLIEKSGLSDYQESDTGIDPEALIVDKQTLWGKKRIKADVKELIAPFKQGNNLSSMRALAKSNYKGEHVLIGGWLDSQTKQLLMGYLVNDEFKLMHFVNGQLNDWGDLPAVQVFQGNKKIIQGYFANNDLHNPKEAAWFQERNQGAFSKLMIALWFYEGTPSSQLKQVQENHKALQELVEKQAKRINQSGSLSRWYEKLIGRGASNKVQGVDEENKKEAIKSAVKKISL